MNAPAQDAAPAVVLFTSDLACSSRVSGAAELAGVRLSVAMDRAALRNAAAEQPIAVVVLDLDARECDVEAIVAELRRLANPPQRVVAFGPHVHEHRLAAARAAGCDAVLPRGQFFGRTADILRSAADQS